MNKTEFLDSLRRALTGRLSPSAVDSQLDYYERYIDTQTGMGRSMEEVLGSLGDPRLIARTIIDSADPGVDSTVPGPGPETHRRREENKNSSSRGKTIVLPMWLTMILVLLVVFLLFRLFVLLLPVIIIGGIVAYIIRIFRNR